MCRAILQRENHTAVERVYSITAKMADNKKQTKVLSYMKQNSIARYK